MGETMAVNSPESNREKRPSSEEANAATETADGCSGEVLECSLQKQLSLLALIRCLRTAQLAPPPIVVPFYQNSCYLEASKILWLGSWYSALAAICEMPSGLLSDVLGRRLTLQLAFLGMGACWIVTYGSILAPQSTIVVWLGLAQFLRALGSSLYSGTDMALLYELLKKHKRQLQKRREKSSRKKVKAGGDDLALKLESRQVVLSTITEAVVAALGGLLSRYYGESTVVLMSALPPLVGAAICFGLEETATIEDGTIETKETHGSSSQGGAEKSVTADKASKSNSESMPPKIPPKEKFERRRSSRIVDTLTQPSLHIIFGIGVVLNCGTYVAATALNPLLWQQVGISNFAGGFLQATNSGMTALGALAAPMLKRQCCRIGYKVIGSNDDGTHGLLLLLLSTSSVAYGLMTWNAFVELAPSLESITSTSSTTSLIQTTSAIGASWLLSLVRGLAWPVLGSALNSAIGDNGTRATVLSLFAGAIKIGMVFTGFALGSILHKSSSLGNACALCTSILLGAVVFCLLGLRGGKDGEGAVVVEDGKKDQ